MVLKKHTCNLEKTVTERTQDIITEKNKTETLLSELLPKSIVELLGSGQKVIPESFDNITILFSDIVGFTRISARASPMDIVVLLNKMYSVFDETSQMFDVYKVATIGDAYMVTSGAPIRNGDRHAVEICNLALALLDSIENFPIPHMPDENLRMRIGVHSGPCVAGVAGVKMPRYLLFGDTVDIAGKMESGGEEMRIHVSETTMALIKHCDHFRIQERGRVFVKGIILLSYWVNRI